MQASNTDPVNMLVVEAVPLIVLEWPVSNITKHPSPFTHTNVFNS